MLILALDALGPVPAAGVWRDGEEVVSLAEEGRAGPADGLAALAHRAIMLAGTEVAALDAIVVATGPGRFTGARMAVALARGLSLASGVPALGVSLFEAGASGRTGLQSVALPGGGGSLWSQTFMDGAPVSEPRPAAADAVAHEFAPDGVLSAVAAVGMRKLAAGPQPRPAPLYTRPPDATPSVEGPVALLP